MAWPPRHPDLTIETYQLMDRLLDQLHSDARAEVDEIRTRLAAIVAEDDARDAIVDAQMALFDNPDDQEARARLRDAIRENIRRKGRSDGSTAWGGADGSEGA